MKSDTLNTILAAWVKLVDAVMGFVPYDMSTHVSADYLIYINSIIVAFILAIGIYVVYYSFKFLAGSVKRLIIMGECVLGILVIYHILPDIIAHFNLTY